MDEALAAACIVGLKIFISDFSCFLVQGTSVEVVNPYITHLHLLEFFSSSMRFAYRFNMLIAVPAGGAGGAIAPPSLEDLGKIKIFRAVRRKYLGKTIIFRAAIRKIWAKSGNLKR